MHTNSEQASHEIATRDHDDEGMRYIAAIAGTLTTILLVLPH